MSLLDFLRSLFARNPSSELSAARQKEILMSIRSECVPTPISQRLQQCRDGTAPWLATLTPAELLINRAHGIRPIAAVSATCWMHYGWSWSKGHAQGWSTALLRLQQEAIAAGANAVIDVKMQTVTPPMGTNMDFTLVGTAVKIEGLPPSDNPIVATIPALEFIRLLEADIVPTGIAVGAAYEWITDWRGNTSLTFMGNTECGTLSHLWERVRQTAHSNLRLNAKKHGNGVLAHLNFSQMFKQEVENQPSQFMARHIVIATTVDTSARKTIPCEFQIVVDMAEKSVLSRSSVHHQAYKTNARERAI